MRALPLRSARRSGRPASALVGQALAVALVGGLAVVAPAAGAGAAEDPAGGSAGTSSPTVTAGADPAYVRRHEVLGLSSQGRRIHAYYRGDPDPRRTLLVVGQMHGDERAGVATARWMKKHITPRAHTGLWIVPTMNPDGYARRARQNARGVDLNRNWPTSGWTSASSSCCWGGPSRASEVETRIMRDFLRREKPTLAVSIHQALNAVARTGKAPRFERRLADALRLPLHAVNIPGETPTSPTVPTMSAWYNSRSWSGALVTVEYRRPTTRAYRTRVAGRGIARAAWLLPSR